MENKKYSFENYNSDLYNKPEIKQEANSKLAKILADLEPIIDVGISREKLSSFKEQRPYEQSSSPDYTDWG